MCGFSHVGPSFAVVSNLQSVHTHVVPFLSSLPPPFPFYLLYFILISITVISLVLLF